MQRTLKFSNYLLEHDWQPIVMTTSPRAHVSIRSDQVGEISDAVTVCRTWAVDAARHLSIRGKYLDISARPDRWSNWVLSAVPVGLYYILRYRPSVIWSTYPIASAHVIGSILSRLTGIPWVADFRDMMFDESFPDEKRMRDSFRKIEKQTVAQCRKVVVTTPGTLNLYENRYPAESREKFVCIKNGYDEENFSSVEDKEFRRTDDEIRLVHSGLLHPSERDPTCFFMALAALKGEGFFKQKNIRITLRATGHDEHHWELIKKIGITDIVSIESSIVYVDALREMMQSDGLLLFQAANCNNQVPAKLYEYFRAGQPIFVITDPAGDTANTARDVGCEDIANINSVADLKSAFTTFVHKLTDGSSRGVPRDRIRQYSRRHLAAQFATVLDGIVAARSGAD